MKIGLFTLATLLSLSCGTKESKDSTSKLALKDQFQKYFKMGCALNHSLVKGDEMFTPIITKEFNTITPENCMKAEVVNPNPGVFNFGQADSLVAFGMKYNMFIVGHTLIWHNQTPKWFFEKEDGSMKSTSEVDQRMHDHIKLVAGRYAGKVQAWDVVNEVIDNDGSYRPTTWVKGMGNGDTLVKRAFRYAALYAPNTELYYNDFNAWRPAKRDGIVKMVKMLKEAGIRIDGIGMQGHWGLNYPDTKDIEDAIDAYASLGVKVMITELDVDVLPLTKEGQIIGSVMAHDQFQLPEFKKFLDPYPNGLPDEIAQLQAKRYKELFEIFMAKQDKIDRVTLWGLHDGMSWKNGYPIPNRTNYPLLWDRQGKEKMALKTLRSLKS
jgi:endo-1,4-beta-xylanase